jgi:P pilus assembly chaperone PapD
MSSPRWLVPVLSPLVGATLALGTWISPAFAQLAISPMVIEEVANQGQAQGVITLYNSGAEPFRARVYARPFTYGRDGIQVLDNSPQDLTPYLLFSPRELVVEPGQTRRIRVVSRLLPSMGEGEYRAILFTEKLDAVPTDGDDPLSVAIIPRIGVTMYVRQGDLAPNLQVLEAIAQPAEGQISLLVSNSGDATVRPTATWALLQNGHTLGSGALLETTVMAGGDRHLPINYQADLEAPLSPGTYTLSGTLTWQFNNASQTLPFSLPVTLSAP